VLSLSDDLHYPNLKAEWFEQEVLPFLDKESTAATTKPSAAPTSAPSASPAERLLTLGQLYLHTGKTDLAREKLQQVIDDYPNDPAAATAGELLEQMKSQ
jgi:TolA-binding protein